MRLFGQMTLLAALALALAACEPPATGETLASEVAFQSAIQTGGVSGTADSSGLLLFFDKAPGTLTADNITVTGATKGILSGPGSVMYLAISNINAVNEGTVTVTITSPSGYAITGSSQSAVVYRAPYVGMPYRGGVVAYILEPYDQGYVAGQIHGLIAATADQSAGISWISGGSTPTTGVPGGTSKYIGMGPVNTDRIIAQAVAAGNYNPASYAAGLARAYNGGGYSDWFLPADEELMDVFLNDFGGHHSYSEYWSSSQVSDSYALYLKNLFGVCFESAKTSSYKVRAVRAF